MAVAALVQEPGWEREGEVESYGETLGTGLTQSGEVSDHLVPTPSALEGDQFAPLHPCHPDVFRRPGPRPGPIHGDDVHGGQLCARAQSLVTVFQLRVVLTTSRCRSR
jgi:hypothetical protein